MLLLFTACFPSRLLIHSFTFIAFTFDLSSYRCSHFSFSSPLKSDSLQRGFFPSAWLDLFLNMIFHYEREHFTNDYQLNIWQTSTEYMICEMRDSNKCLYNVCAPINRMREEILCAFILVLHIFSSFSFHVLSLSCAANFAVIVEKCLASFKTILWRLSIGKSLSIRILYGDADCWMRKHSLLLACIRARFPTHFPHNIIIKHRFNWFRFYLPLVNNR